MTAVRGVFKILFTGFSWQVKRPNIMRSFCSQPNVVQLPGCSSVWPVKTRKGLHSGTLQTTLAAQIFLRKFGYRPGRCKCIIRNLEWYFVLECYRLLCCL